MRTISNSEAITIADTLYSITGNVSTLPGDEDFNFKITTASSTCFVLKVSIASHQEKRLGIQNELLHFLSEKELPLAIPQVLLNNDREKYATITLHGTQYHVRLITYVQGRLWAKVNPKTSVLRHDLGTKAGAITKALLDFKPFANTNNSHWDLANVAWTREYMTLFEGKKLSIVKRFQSLFSTIEMQYKTLPKSTIHGDVNDYNILVSNNLKNLEVAGIIDFGDATYTQTINDVAITIAYGAMEVPDPLEAALDILKGYATQYHFTENELHCLYALVAMRLVTTVTKAALRKQEDSNNTYHSVSEQAAWSLLEKWQYIHPDIAEYSFRNTSGFEAHPNKFAFEAWAKNKVFSFSALFPSEILKTDIYLLDLKLSSTWVGSKHEFNNLDLFEFKINQLQKQHPTKLIADGYLEPRPIYTAATYDKKGNTGTESRTVHLGVDFWLPAQTPVLTLFDAEVVTAVHDTEHKQYGGLVILKHKEDGLIFYTLYGHLSLASATALTVGDILKKGDKIGVLGNAKENGQWAPHLHFQIMLTMLDYTIDFPGVAYPQQMQVWKSICPDPNLLFKNPKLVTEYDASISEIIAFRGKHLGKSLSISYQEPLHIVRGDGAYLIDTWGVKYLDTVNNVAHVGHEHPAVVKAAQEQMALLNTNTRYLNENIIAYTRALLEKLPPELSVLHFVNSGSEATELALRMARTVTGQKEILAIEVGYHGNTTAAMEVSSYKFDSQGGFGKPEHTHILPLPDPYRGLHTKEKDLGSIYANYAQQHIDRLALVDRGIAGFMGESIISCGGQIVPPEGYFKALYKTVRAAGGLCIADEVQTGFGRMGDHFWGFEMHGVIPDIVTMGKPAGNGHPLAIVACTQEVANSFANGLEFFNTFGGNPVSCSIGSAVLDVIAKEALQKNAKLVGGFLKNELHKLQQKHTIIGDVRGAGLFLGIELNDAEKKPLPEQASYLANRMKDFKILMSTDGPNHNVLKIKPPMVFSIDNAKELIFRLHGVFQEDFMTHY
ncbi:MAG: 4-aminobutyrate aminotransferase-like enzyme/Ser/Thr protein kinase RdoA (MazF antagonist) [Saprospiraceae bacterium]|jgi:4-aminobutyrate aminotransferase-like enzyme/Ser/Thr protein kinase RdoA (MazF antagonist)